MTTTQSLKRVLIMAGGTGGHVFPGLALAKCLQQQGVEVHWLGAEHGLETKLVPDNGYKLHRIAISGLRGKGVAALLTAPFKILKAICQSMQVINKIKPDIIVGMGGFVSGPGGIAGWLSRRPLVIHEQNAKAGVTNKLLAIFSKRVLEGFPQAFAPNAKVIVTGNPVRADIEALPPPSSRLVPQRGQFRLLVLGGSLGAKALNDLLPKALVQLGEDERPEVWHQAGDKHIDDAKKSYESMGLKVNIQPFIKDMAAAYSWADMVLCRAGALTVAELCATGLGAVLVPYPYAVDDHQTANADYMVRSGAALCIQQTELTDTRLAEIIREFARAPDKRLAMAQASYVLRKVNVAEAMAKILSDLV